MQPQPAAHGHRIARIQSTGDRQTEEAIVASLALALAALDKVQSLADAARRRLTATENQKRGGQR